MYKEALVTIESAFPLSGTLTMPEEKQDTYPAVLIIAGSGKGDRDGNLKNLQMNVYKELAEFLATQGYMTLRYDKRGTYKSKGSFNEAGLSDLIDDAVEGVRFLKRHPNADPERILILGHSEGAMIAPAVHNLEPVDGMILLAGAAEPSADLMPRQNEMAYEEMNETEGLKGWIFRTFKVTDRARKQNEQIFSKVANSDKPVMRVKGIRLNAKWLRETLDYNVVEYLTRADCPVLAVTGSKDLQVPPEHARLIAETVPGESEWHIIPDMNHLLKEYEGEHTMLGLLKEYKSIADSPLSPGLTAIIGDWLAKKRSVQPG
ncbi:Esterase/lipase [Bhargavaea cecembensis DSE10]|uniref:Esterase/lipase n=1 Tax=Bhargavaea cecembensis DSE10 TaxID=1235279 RepID=M7NWF9_9BACL|nr:alpha/beta fold hydrolase [Bhargavaea cecembensis]EMR05995.1 Esterase/lipase [Bhargavaea cecembensis DSE10]